MGISRAVLTIADEQRDWSLSQKGSLEEESSRVETHSLSGEIPAILVLAASKEDFTENQFALLADIAAETWSKGTARWFEINEVPFTFDSKAKESANPQRQKLRKLYKPSY